MGLTPSTQWHAVARTTWDVPGTPVAAWAGPEGASLVVYRTLPIPGGNASAIARSLAVRLTNLPDLKVVDNKVETWGGVEAARVELVAPGTGGALAPSGTGVPRIDGVKALVPTHRVVVGIPRASETLYLSWHAPESANPWLQEQVRAALKDFRLDAPSVPHSY